MILLYPSANRDESVFDDPVHLRHRPQPEPARRVRVRDALLPRRVTRPARAAHAVRAPHPADHEPARRDRARHRAEHLRRRGALATGWLRPALTARHRRPVARYRIVADRSEVVIDALERAPDPSAGRGGRGVRRPGGAGRRDAGSRRPASRPSSRSRSTGSPRRNPLETAELRRRIDARRFPSITGRFALAGRPPARGCLPRTRRGDVPRGHLPAEDRAPGDQRARRRRGAHRGLPRIRHPRVRDGAAPCADDARRAGVTVRLAVVAEPVG